MRSVKIFISGPVTGIENYKETFGKAEERLKNQGHDVMNPAWMPAEGFEHAEYMHVCEAMIDVCEAVCFLPGWQDSAGSRWEYVYAKEEKKKIMYPKGEE